jgi:hypothetical protein
MSDNPSIDLQFQMSCISATELGNWQAKPLYPFVAKNE